MSATGSQILNGLQQYTDGNGKPYAGGRLHHYVVNTMTPVATYQDIDLTVLNSAPIILDAAGRASVWTSLPTTRQILYDKDGNLIWDRITSTGAPQPDSTGSTTVVELVPVGTRVGYSGPAASVPTGWLLCFGQAVSRTTYNRLFAVIGTTYGVGDGSTTFNLPDHRGRTAVGKDDMGGSAASRVTLAVAGFDATVLGAAGGDQRFFQHTHSLTDSGHIHTGSTASAGDHTHTASVNIPVVTSFSEPPGPAVSGLVIGEQISTANISVAVSTNGAHTHGATIASNTTGITIANAGSGTSQNVQPSITENVIIYAGGTPAGTIVPAHTHPPSDIVGFPCEISVACGDETTNLTTGSAKVTIHAPYPFTLTEAMCGLTAVSTSGAVEVDIDKNGVSIFLTRPTIDANEETTLTAAVPQVISTNTFAKGDKITFDIVAAGTNAKGLKVYLIGTRIL